MEKVRYLELTDYDNRGTIIRQEGRKFFKRENGDWVRCGISIGYFLPDAPEFECYKEIPEKEALQKII